MLADIDGKGESAKRVNGQGRVAAFLPAFEAGAAVHTSPRSPAISRYGRCLCHPITGLELVCFAVLSVFMVYASEHGRVGVGPTS